MAIGGKRHSSRRRSRRSKSKAKSHRRRSRGGFTSTVRTKTFVPRSVVRTRAPYTSRQLAAFNTAPFRNEYWAKKIKKRIAPGKHQDRSIKMWRF